MQELPSLPSYLELMTQLKETLPEADAAELHGLLCGYICSTSGNQNAPWEKLILGNKKNKQVREMLQQLFEASFHQLSEFSFEFSLVLPADDTSLTQRAEGLGFWCQGFLTGLKQADITAEKNNLPDEVADTLKDIAEIALVNFDDITANEEDETAYFELVEYVRLAVLTIYHELNSNQLQQKPRKDEPLH